MMLDETYDVAVTDGLTDKQEHVLTALLAHSTVRHAAKAANVSEATIYRYKKDPAFMAALRDARDQQMQDAIGHLKSGTVEALEALRDVYNDPSKPSTARVSAASKWIGYAFRAHFDMSELDSLIERLRSELGEDIDDDAA
jgi:hypothetical protein